MQVNEAAIQFARAPDAFTSLAQRSISERMMRPNAAEDVVAIPAPTADRLAFTSSLYMPLLISALSLATMPMNGRIVLLCRQYSAIPRFKLR